VVSDPQVSGVLWTYVSVRMVLGGYFERVETFGFLHGIRNTLYLFSGLILFYFSACSGRACVRERECFE
jgi:hypothetical protein